MKIDLLLALLAVPVSGGIAATWLWGRRRERASVSDRLQKFLPEQSQAPVSILKTDRSAPLFQSGLEGLHDLLGLSWLRTMLVEAALEDQFLNLILAVGALLILPPVVAYFTHFSLLIAGVTGLILAVMPIGIVRAIADARRSKFCEQLPDAIDLMVAVLRSGHSVSQAVKAVSLEIPKPCGDEFGAVLQRMNLGQPLSDSLVLSTRTFQSYELDLLRRAVAIQAEVGGSLAELLDKTNGTLRERLKLVRQLKVVTAQSRLSANIVGLLPVVLAIGLNILSPGYLNVLLGDPLGRILLVVVIVLEVLGVFVMRRMSTMKV